MNNYFNFNIETIFYMPKSQLRCNKQFRNLKKLTYK